MGLIKILNILYDVFPVGIDFSVFFANGFFETKITLKKDGVISD